MKKSYVRFVPHIVCIVFVSMLGIATVAQPQTDNRPVSVPPQSINVDLHNVVGEINYTGQVRQIFRNSAPTSPVKAVYEPAFTPVFNPARSGSGRLSLTIHVDSPSYKEAATIAARGVSDELIPLVRLPYLQAIFTLAPDDPATPPYIWSKPKVVNTDSSDSYDIDFDVPTTSLDESHVLSQLSSLRVSYTVASQNTASANTSISLVVKQTALFSNRLNGPVDGGDARSLSVAVTRNQIADAISRGWIILRQETRQQAGGDPQLAELSREAASKLFPVLIDQLVIQSKPFDDAVKQLANFSFDGEDAGTRIKDYLDKTSTLVKNDSSNKVHINGSTEANVMGIFGGKLGFDFDKSNTDSSLRSNDSTLQWTGDKFVPASLNVTVLRTGTNVSFGQVDVAETMLLGDTAATRSFSVDIEKSSGSGELAQIPIGAVVPFCLTPAEVLKLAPTWLPANGQVINDRFSPLNGRNAPSVNGDRFVLGSSESIDVTKEDSNQGGSRAFTADVRVSGTTSPQNLFDLQGRVAQNRPPRLVIDTSVDEILSAQHNHTFDVTASFSKDLPMPPFRRLVFLIRVRY